MFTRPHFDAACKAFIARHSTDSTTFPLKDWTWHEHISYPNLGFMSRVVDVFHRPDIPACALDGPEGGDGALEEADPTVLPKSLESELLICQQYVVFSATFRVPTFYFLLCDSSGTSLPLAKVLTTSLFKANAWDHVEVSSYALSVPTSTFPLLSHGDHPTLGFPCWYFHPCETTAAVDELVGEIARDDWSEEVKAVRWLEMWFLVVCNVVNL